MKALAVAVALAFAFPPALASWDTYHGQADRNGVAQLPSGPLDVTISRTLDRGPMPFWGAQSLPTPHGLIMLQTDARSDCRLVVLEAPDAPARNITKLDLCAFAYLTGYDPTADLAILCFTGGFTQPILQARNLDDGTLRWSQSAQGLGFANSAGFYSCASSAFDEPTGTILTPVSEGIGVNGEVAGSRLTSVNRVDGTFRWSTPIPAQVPVIPGGVIAVPSSPQQVAPARAWGVAITSGGTVTTGYYGDCTFRRETCEGFVAWFDPRGSVRGVELAQTKTGAPSSTAGGHAVSQYAVSSGPIAALAIGDEVVLINPSTQGTIGRAPLHAFEPVTTNTLWITGAWTHDAIIIGLPHSLSAFSPVNLQPKWTWTRGQSWEIAETMLDSSGTLNVVSLELTTRSVVFVRVDAATGQTLSTLPLPIDLPRDYYAHLVPMPGWGLVMVDNFGNLVVLGTADPALAPKLAISNAFPTPGEAIRITPSGNATSFVFNWGDGTEENVTSSRPVNHTFPTYGHRDVRVTSILADGRTATTVAAIDVGGTPPPELNAVQRAFSPENQNLTFGVLGIIITILGAAFTIGRTRRRIARLERELAAVEEIRVLSTRDPREAARVLRDYRDNLPGDLTRRRIDDSQYAVLDTHSSRLLRVLKTRLFSPYDPRFSPEFRRLLDAAFDDAVLQPSERDALVETLQRETNLTPVERSHVQDILGDFTSARDALGHRLA